MKKHIPNFLTLLNLTSGSLALYMVLNHQPVEAFWFFIASTFFDFADGLAARLLKATSAIGKQLDSLADMVSFGLVPAAMIFMLLTGTLGEEAGVSVLLEGPGRRSPVPGFTDSSGEVLQGIFTKIMQISVLLVPVFAAWRLARFNLLPSSEFFTGLPTPAFGLFWAGIYFDVSTTGTFFGQNLSSWFIWAVMLITSVLMVIPFPLLSLKFSNFKIIQNFLRYLLIIIASITLLFVGFPGLSIIILTYIILSLIRILFILRG